MNEKIIATAVIGFSGFLLTCARRYRNKDTEAGYGIAGWTVAILFFMWVVHN